MKGLLIVFEGVDGCGKTTQLNRAKKFLEYELGADRVLVSKEPGGTVLGDGLRTLLFTSPGTKNMADGVMDLLFLASHLQNWHEVVKPALDAGKVVLCDRWWYSQMIYMNWRKVPPSIARAYKEESKGEADLLVTLVGSSQLLFDRANANTSDRAHQGKKAWNNIRDIADIQEMYLTFARELGGDSALIDVSDRSIDEVWLELQSVLTVKLIDAGFMQDFRDVE